MTLQQLEYITAIDAYRNFSSAAASCHVTQPTLSAMVQKLEEELDIKIFDRSRQPVIPTSIGKKVIAQAHIILQNVKQLQQLVADEQEIISGELHIGIIPTLAPYLLPLFLKEFSAHFPLVHLQITERLTDSIIHLLKTGQLDAGILATPLRDRSLIEDPIFWEEFIVYAPLEISLQEKSYILPDDIDTNRLLLLEEGHCIRSQIINLCGLQQNQNSLGNVTYEAGSLETLRRLVETHAGITILPELALLELNEDQMQHIRFFKPPAPVREISIVVNRGFVKQKLVEALKQEILSRLPIQVSRDRQKTVVSQMPPK